MSRLFLALLILGVAGQAHPQNLPLHLSLKESEALVARDIDKWTQLIRSAGITAD